MEVRDADYVAKAGEAHGGRQHGPKTGVRFMKYSDVKDGERK